MVHWVLERNVFSEECFDNMIDYFNYNHIEFDVVTIIPFSHEIEGKVPVITDKNVVCYGSIGIQKLAKKMNWTPGVWSGALSEEALMAFLGDNYLNSDLHIMPIQTVPEALENLKWDEFFIKPNTDTKEFAGTTMDSHAFSLWYEQMKSIGYLDHNNFDVVISTPKNIGREWRLVIVDGQVADYSIYRQYNIVKPERKIDTDVLTFAKECILLYNPCDVFVMDICETDEGFKVVEYNTFNSAGLYKCNVSNVIFAINWMLNNRE